MRENVLAIRLTDEEWNDIEDMAGAAQLPLSTYVRAFVLTQKPPAPKASGIDAEAVAALNRVGSLLNQIARVGNTSKTFSAADIRGVTAARERLSAIAEQLEGDQT
jgi:hypothetical protein